MCRSGLWPSITILVTVASGLLGEARGQNCPRVNVFLNTCYVIPKAEANWIGAVRYCQALNGHLAVIDSQGEQDFVAALVNSDNFGHTLLFQTPDLYSYRYLEDNELSVHGHTSISFMVQACHDAHIALSASKISSFDTYEIVIGGWLDSQSVIRDCMQCAHMDQVSQQDHPLNCNAMLPFWLSWQDGNVRLGTGMTVGEGQMLSWQDPSPHDVNYLAISTGFGSTGTWKFPVRTYQSGVLWLGMSDLLVEGEWTSGPLMEEIEYVHWAAGQPTAQAGRHCAGMDTARALAWIDADCEIRRNFVCELDRHGLGR